MPVITMHLQPTSTTRRAFSLIELMIVILIIALVISIAIPSLNGARNASRNAGSRALMNQIAQSAAQFERDERRLPGYFDARAMGHSENGGPSGANPGRGFTAMQNMMLDLAGGITTDPVGGSIVEVGPTATDIVRVDTRLIGTAQGNSKMYFVPDRTFFIAQNEAGQMAATEAGHTELPSVIDSFSNPVLAWVKNEMATTPITTEDQFARVASPTSANDPAARFYWNTNSGFLKATGTGRKLYNQTDDVRGSLLRGSLPDQNRQRSLIGILGHPSYPYRPQNSTMPPSIPASPRGSIIIHSAGTDGIYFSRLDRGARRFNIQTPMTPATEFIDYRTNFAPDPTQQVSATNQYTDRDDRPTNEDLTTDFDDVLVVGGN